jgi:hypothetical protein
MAYSDGHSAIPIRNKVPDGLLGKTLSHSKSQHSVRCPPKKDFQLIRYGRWHKMSYSRGYTRTCNTYYDFVKHANMFCFRYSCVPILFASDIFFQICYVQVHLVHVLILCCGFAQKSKNVFINVSQIKLMVQFPVGSSNC